MFYVYFDFVLHVQIRIDSLRGGQKAAADKMAKEKKRLGGCLKGFLAFILLVVVGLVVLTGVTISKLTVDHHDLEIMGDEQDYQSGMEKAKTVVKGDITALHLLNIYNGKYEVQGSVPVEAVFTNAETYAILNKANETSGPMRNIQIKWLQGNKFEFYGVVDESIMSIVNKHMGLNEEDNPVLVKWIGRILHNKPVYGKGSFDLVSPNYVEIDMETVVMGNRTLKDENVSLIRNELRNLINKAVSLENGVSIEELTVENGALHYEGTLPREIKGQ